MVKGPAGEPPYDWISTIQAAQRLGIAHRTLHRRIEREGLPAYRLGRVFRLRAHEVDAWGKGDAPLSRARCGAAESPTPRGEAVPDLLRAICW